MTDREKLTGILKTCEEIVIYWACSYEEAADYLIANGVTFATGTPVADNLSPTEPLTNCQKWISVEDRLPECKQDVLMYFDTGNMAVGWWYDRDEVITFWSAYSDDGWYTDCECEPLYWMPLPEPPKE